LGKSEPSVGNREVAQKEVCEVEKGVAVIKRFLPEMSGEPRSQIETGLAEVQTILSALKREVEAALPS
jgi:hypothetical protein